MDGLMAVAEAAERLGIDLAIPDLLILAAARLRIELDGEDQADVVRWARKQLGMAATTVDELLALQAQGLSVRAIARMTGIPKSSVALRLSQAAALAA